MSSTPEQTIAREETPEDDPAQQPADDKELVVEDMLIEDVSIDGMCGVY
jgi:mycofactocin precursor